jgi:predicted RNA binding protein YcfA (HicA-like mRNA interferase family)
MSMKDLPAITGFQLIRLLELDGWQRGKGGRHLQALWKYVVRAGRTLVTVVPEVSHSLPKGTLGDILSVKQTRLGRRGLGALIEKHGLR